MTHDELKNKLEFLFDGKEAVSLTMYFVVADGDTAQKVVRAQVSDAARDALFSQFKAALDEKLYSNQDLLLMDISKVNQN